MRSLRAVLADRRDKARPQRVVYVGSHEDRLSRVPAMRLSDDDNGRTTEDVRRQKAEGRGLYGGGPPSRLVD
jgi:hypothetical protein